MSNPVWDRLNAVVGEWTGSIEPSQIAGLIEALRLLTPRLSHTAGEPLEVQTDRSGDRHEQRLNMNIVGAATGDRYGTLTVSLANSDGELNLDPITAVPLFLWCSLNNPDQVPDWVLAALADRGVSMLRCDYCPAEFARWQDAVDHERDEHGVTV